MIAGENIKTGLEKVKEWVSWCPKCNSCKYLYKDYAESCPAGEHFKFETYWSSGKVWLAYGLLNGILKWNENIIKIIYACPLCGACSVQCQQDVSDHLIEIFEALREEAVSRGFGPYSNQKAFYDSIIANNNPYKEPHSNRLNWLDQKELKTTAEVLYFVGCTSSYREKELAKSTFELLKKLNVDFTISPDEHCCGSPALRTGQVNVIPELIKKNMDIFKKSGAKTIVTSCAGCYRTLKIDYPKILGKELPFEILHISEFIFKLMKEGKLKIDKEKPIKITYHDPCHLGRHAGVFDEPREILKNIPELELIEMRRIRENSWCCGAGGGVKSGFKDWAVEIAIDRLKEAEQTGAEDLITSCPFCLRNFKDAAKSMGSNLKIFGIVELLKDLI
ncbi:MAG: (Fe-S)-binding protein [Candidatus Helarchaeota archaeon]